MHPVSRLIAEPLDCCFGQAKEKNKQQNKLNNNRGRNKRLKYLPQISGLDFAVVLLGLLFKEWEHISQKKSSWLLSLQDPFSQQK